MWFSSKKSDANGRCLSWIIILLLIISFGGYFGYKVLENYGESQYKAEQKFGRIQGYVAESRLQGKSIFDLDWDRIDKRKLYDSAKETFKELYAKAKSMISKIMESKAE